MKFLIVIGFVVYLASYMLYCYRVKKLANAKNLAESITKVKSTAKKQIEINERVVNELSKENEDLKGVAN